MEIIDPEAQGLDPEKFWMVSRVAIVEEHYFETEEEAVKFAETHFGFKVDAPVQPIPNSAR